MANKRQLGQADDEPDAAPLGGADFAAGALIPAVQAARLFHRTTRTLRNWEQRGWLPGVRIGRSLYFKAGDIERLIAGDVPFVAGSPGPSPSRAGRDSMLAHSAPTGKKRGADDAE